MRLDGNKIDCVWIHIDGIGALGIGGGPEKFIVVSLPADGSSLHVETGNREVQNVRLQVGVQIGLYSGVMILSAETAFAIAERFLLATAYDESLTGFEDCPSE